MITKTNQNGRSMIEMLGVLAIIGVLSVGGIAGYSKAMQKYRTNKMIDQITQIANGVRTLYSGQRNYAGININVLRKAKILPESAFDGNSSGAAAVYGITPFGGNMVIEASSKSTSRDNKAFSISLYSVPEDACIEILTQDWGDSSGLIVYGFDISGTNSAPGCTNSEQLRQCAKDGPMSVSKAMQICEQLPEESNYTIGWKFY